MIKARNTNLEIFSSQFSFSRDSTIMAKDSNLTVVDTTFFSGGNFNMLGGAIHCECQEVLVRDSTFQDNRAASGAGMYLIGSKNGRIRVYGNTF